tara:strand:+ start:287 stop:529 length:243 start_codon:yes stop_codon:yes gene_type:complete
MNEPDWENIRGLRVIGWMVSFGWQDGKLLPPRTNKLGKTGKNFEVVGYFKPDQDKLLLLRDVAGYSSELYEVHFSWVILG